MRLNVEKLPLFPLTVRDGTQLRNCDLQGLCLIVQVLDMLDREYSLDDRIMYGIWTAGKSFIFLEEGGCLQKAVFGFRAKRHLLELESYQMNPREETKEGANLIACELIKCGPRGPVRDEIDKLKTAQRP
ncbi:hypothetical protein NPIL_549321 [Nephila pilipes]|uniref:Uncharacterized protein n=1 Tax=Nephila pilipes TaxID=299642 RepID=A0A8X6Q9A2_NEPPI|nr:hypothetical protein NPIL_549321 [Nephila pilipes]